MEADVLLSQVDPGLGAAKAGLKPDDVLISADGQQIRSMTKLQRVIQESKGTPVSLVVSRNEKLMHFSFSLKNGATDGQWRIGVLLGAKVKMVSLAAERGVRRIRYNGTSATPP